MAWFRRSANVSRKDKEIDLEIAFHLEELSREYIARGMTPSEARRQALLLFGGAEQVKQQTRDVHVFACKETILTNFRSAMRFIRKAPSFATAVVLTLALGIGANSAVFSAIDAVLLRPLRFPHAGELVQIHEFDRMRQNSETLVAPPRLLDWDRLSSTFQAISGYYTEDATLTSGSLPEKETLALVAPRFLQVWGVSPKMGRDFTEAEGRFGGPNAILISDRFWRGRLQADPAAVGRFLRLGNSSYTIVGVMPPSFLFPNRDVDLWSPNPSDAPYAQSRDATWFTVFGRMKPGVPLSRAQADITSVQGQLARQYGKPDTGLRVQLVPLKLGIVGKARDSLWLLYGSVSMLLLIACTNIAGLLMARTAEREHEISIRYSLGATRPAIIGQLLTEVLVLAVTGSLLGLALAAGASHVFTQYAKDLPRIDEIALNGRVVAYSLVCAVLATLLCGLFPALRGTRRSLSESLSRAGRAQVSPRASWQWGFIGVQVSLAVTMLIASGLLLRSFHTLGLIDPGFDPEHVLTLRVSGSWSETSDMAKLKQRVDRTLEGLRNVPGVEAAATSGTIPGNADAYPTSLKVLEGSAGDQRKVAANMQWVSTDYFKTLRIPLLQGSSCQDGLPYSTMVVNRSFARRYFPGVIPIGYHLRLLPENAFSLNSEIRGVVGDAREQGLDTEPEPAVYWCTSAPSPDPNYLIRTQGDPAAMADTLRKAIRAMEPSRAVFEIKPLVDHLGDRQAEIHLRTMLLTTFALTAILLVSVGLYGTVSYLGRTRRREVGLRLALGAMPSQIMGSMLLQGFRVTLGGGLAGLVLGAGLSRSLRGMLFGVSPLDPGTYVGVLALILVVSAAATVVPSLRSTRVNPTQVLRED